MFDFLLRWIESEQTATNALIIALCSVVVISSALCIAAFFQGRSIEFWPPRIGERPFSSLEASRTDRTLIAVGLFLSALVLSVLLATRQSGASFQHQGATGHVPTIGWVTVAADAGFQNSGIYLNQGDKVLLSPDGRIHLARLQMDTFLSLAKSIIAYNLPETELYKRYKETHQLISPATGEALVENLNKATVLATVTGGELFRRDWIGPDGEEIDSRDLNACLLFQGNSKQKGTWGMLLAQVMENPGSAVIDPVEILTENNLALSDLVPVISRDTVFEAPHSGWLTFIVNDAVLSTDGHPDRQPCSDYREALRQAAGILKQDGDNFRIPERSIPLTWYSDNLGSFNVVISPPNR